MFEVLQKLNAGTRLEAMSSGQGYRFADGDGEYAEALIRKMQGKKLVEIGADGRVRITPLGEKAAKNPRMLG